MLPLRSSPGAALAAALSVTAVVLTTASCRCNKPDAGSGNAEADAAAPVSSDETDGSGAGGSSVGASRFLDASPKAAVDQESPVDPACTGPEISFATVVVDERCAIRSSRAKALRAALERDDGGAVTLRQEATIDASGRVSLRMINTGASALTLPISYSAKLPAFTALAEDERHAIYELEPPRFEVRGAAAAEGAGRAGEERAHFARIVLPPGGVAVATVTLGRRITNVLERGRDAGAGCADGGDCAPARLGKGRYTVHVGELLTDVEAGPPARATWDLP